VENNVSKQKAWLASNGSVLELSRDLARFLH
jgi:hypothetical protein